MTIGAASVERWPGIEATLEGDLVVLEPLTADHERELFEAARDPEIWTWLDSYLGESEEAFHTFMEGALAAAEAGREQPLATRDARSGRLVGSTRFIALRPDDRALEIGWTWLNPSAWRTGINVEAKLLMLRSCLKRISARCSCSSASSTKVDFVGARSGFEGRRRPAAAHQRADAWATPAKQQAAH